MRWIASVVALVLVAASCSGDESVPTSTVSESTSPSTASTAASGSVTPELTVTHEIFGFGFTIDYPEGWSVDTVDTVTAIAEHPEDLEEALESDVPMVAGVTVLLDHRPLSFMEGLGLPADNPTNQDLLELNARIFQWSDIEDQGSQEVFGAPALIVRVTNQAGQAMIAAQAVRADAGDIFLLTMRAPTEDELQAAMSTWEAILESIEPIGADSDAFTQRLDVGGVEMFITCRGEGSPTVVFEAPRGAGSGIWRDVLTSVGEQTRACAYDRAGIGNSDPPSERSQRSGRQITDELAALLEAADVDQPYVIVGHSFGGLLARIFASAHPDVEGLVLVESTHPDLEERLVAAGLEAPPREDEIKAIAEEASAASLPANLPLIVITRGRPESVGQVEEIWKELQLELVDLSDNSLQLIAAHSAHNVPADEPEVIVEAVRLMLNHIRSPSEPLAE